MKIYSKSYWTTVLTISVVLSPQASAELQIFEDMVSWSNAVQHDFTTIDFTGYSNGVVITNQYQDLGAVFTTGDDTINGPSTNLYPNDGWGLQGNEEIIVEFDTPQHIIAASTPGFFEVWLYLDDTFVGASPTFFEHGGEIAFGGLISEDAFNRAVFFDPADDNVVFDDIYFGDDIPAPATAVLFALACVATGMRRRH